jgi:hypothetical protein
MQVMYDKATIASAWQPLDFSMTDLHNTINIGRDARNIITARQQEHVEVEAYSPSNYHIPQHYLSSTRKRKPDAPLQPWSNQPEARKLLALNNASRRPSTGIACGIRMVCTPPSHATTSKGPWEFHRSRTSGRKTTKKGGKTTQMTIYLKIKNRSKEVY